MTPSAVENRLADAGQVLLALPYAGCFPAGSRTLWPGYDEASSHGSFLPSRAEISAMETRRIGGSACSPTWTNGAWC